ncbi:MAG: aldehyde ferredoxin oxidoreductase family protein [Chloroflexota bacterium]
MAGGYMGRVLRVDLTSRTCQVQELDEQLARKYIGGTGLAARYLYDETDEHTDPLGPDNKLVFAVGPLTGTVVPTSCRFGVAARSPLTGIWGEADCGGQWGAEFKGAGFDAVILSGAASEPVYLWIADGKAEIRSAEHLWGRDTYETAQVLSQETDSRAQTVCIGPAGERLIPIASIMNDGRDARAAGRAGLGAVMGSKRLKAIVARGSRKTPIADASTLRASVKEAVPGIVQATAAMATNGTDNGMIGFEASGDLPIQNWRMGSWTEGALKISGQTMTETILTGRYHCRGCVIGCGRKVRIGQGISAGLEIGGPEYETAGSMGAMCLVDDLVVVAQANDLCNRFGLDTISAGATIAFAMECYEKGLLSREDCDGLDLTWGNGKAVLALIDKIGRQEGIGKLLSQGTRRAAAAIGRGADNFAMHVKGLEMPMHDPRAFSSLAVGYATSNRGACHLQGFSHAYEGRVVFRDLGYDAIADRFADEGKGILVAKAQNLMALYDSLKLCKFLVFGQVRPTTILNWLNYVTSWGMDFDEFMTCGERLFNLKRMYNVRLGIRRADDTLPTRILKEPRGSGGAADNLPNLEKQLTEYYDYRGWDENGVPKAQKLSQLSLSS